MFEIKLTKRARKDLSALPKQTYEKILDSLELLRINPFAEILQFKKLRTRQNLYRIRVGNYQVIYEVHGNELIIIVVRIGHRKDVYRYLKKT